MNDADLSSASFTEQNSSVSRKCPRGTHLPIVVSDKLVGNFWARVQKTDFCWLWIGRLNPKGYGVISVSSGSARFAHRVAWVICRGPISNGLHVLHKCDNPKCCNPEHLFLGTHQDNMADRDAKGRGRFVRFRGEGHRSAKLKEVEVLEILTAKRTRGSNAALARKFGVSPATMYDIQQRRSWAHLSALTPTAT